jgi:3-isopropylmalate/(R)-2-methylmalate dehydratase small subunit
VEPVEIVEGKVVPLWREDVDTDQIMPKQFLKRIDRTGFGEVVFHHWRQRPDFVLNDERFAGGTILVSGANFGSGSSREHAPWGLQQYGFRAVVAPSFGDIFRSNCGKIGLLTVQLPEDDCRALADVALREPGAEARIDLPAQQVSFEDRRIAFDIDAHTKHLLVSGLDPIDLTLQREDRIAAHEADRPGWLPETSRL